MNLDDVGTILIVGFISIDFCLGVIAGLWLF